MEGKKISPPYKYSKRGDRGEGMNSYITCYCFLIVLWLLFSCLSYVLGEGDVIVAINAVPCKGDGNGNIGNIGTVR